MKLEFGDIFIFGFMFAIQNKSATIQNILKTN